MQRLWWWYAFALLAIGLLQGSAELQHYLHGGGAHPWEPYLWEFSSILTGGALAPLVYRWHVATLAPHASPGFSPPRRLFWRRVLRHMAGALAFVLVHVAGMFALRYLVYALAGVQYHPGSAASVLGYEAGKDIVSYALIVAIGHGIYLFIAQQRLRSELAEERLARLGEQLQPHFLFNSLNLISSVMYEDVARADRLLCDLSDLLRQTLAAQQAVTHTLDAELGLIAPYLALMQARFGARLRVTIDADDAARRCLVPALLLISPVENAITHDVAHRAAPVLVALRAWVEAGVLQISVENSGVAPAPTLRDGATGLANLRARLHALHGARASVTLTARAGGGSCLLLALQARPA